MARDRSLVRASDIGAWSYCNRSWWLANVQHAEHTNPAALAGGTKAHDDHGRLVARGRDLQRLGLLLLAGGLLLAGLWLLAILVR